MSEKIKYWWSEDRRWFCIRVNDGTNHATVSLTVEEAEALMGEVMQTPSFLEFQKECAERALQMLDEAASRSTRNALCRRLTMTDHTPTPWDLFDVNGILAIRNPRAQSSKSEIVFWSGFDASHYPKQARANAAFIVKAVNSYDEAMRRLGDVPGDDLLERLNKLLGWYQEICNEVRRLSAVGGAHD